MLQLGRELHARLSTMGGHYDKLGRALGSAVNAYNATLASLEGRVMVSARRFRDLNVTDDELAEITPVEEPLRSISDGELVEDAVQVEPMIGRRRRSSRGSHDLPEAEALERGEPDLFELTASEDRPPARRRDHG